MLGDKAWPTFGAPAHPEIVWGQGSVQPSEMLRQQTDQDLQIKISVLWHYEGPNSNHEGKTKKTLLYLYL